MNELFDWVFHYNPYTQKWNATKREHATELFNGNNGHVISSSSVDTLVELIIKGQGDFDKINELVK